MSQTPNNPQQGPPPAAPDVPESSSSLSESDDSGSSPREHVFVEPPVPVGPVSLANVPVPPPDRLIQFQGDRYAPELMYARPDPGPFRLIEGDDRYLFTQALCTCTGIAVSGVYPPLDPNSPPGTRYNRFLMHSLESKWEADYGLLEGQVREAMNIGLHDLQIHVVAAHPDSYIDQERYGQKDADDSYEAQRGLMAKLRALLGDGPDIATRIHWYPYKYDDLMNAGIALYSNREVLVNQEGYKCRWELEEKQWLDPAVSKVPLPTTPRED
ncbi:hypothetical protein PG984_005064 [Apiospora sp. TS-2023a]